MALIDDTFDGSYPQTAAPILVDPCWMKDAPAKGEDRHEQHYLNGAPSRKGDID